MNNDDYIDLSPLYSFVGQHKLSLTLIVSILSSLFMPAMFTFNIGFPLFILSCIVYVSYRDKDIKLFIGLVVGIVGVSVLSIGLLYILAFNIFISIFPTFVVIILTLFILQYMPYHWTKSTKILFVLVVSLFFGLNTTIIKLIKPVYEVQENIQERLVIQKKDIIQISNNSSYPAFYNPYDFLSFGSNEGCMCGYWEKPRIENSDIKIFLQRKEISYTANKDLPQKIELNYDQTEENLFHLSIDIKSNDKIVSTLKITDKVPFSGDDTSKVSLETFSYRLEFLQRHNIWHAILYYFFPTKHDINTIVNQFLEKSLDVQFEKPKDWAKNLYNFSTLLVYASPLHECSNYKNDNYKDYEFNQWKQQNTSLANISFLAENRLFFKYEDVIYSTKLYSILKMNWSNYNIASVTEKGFYATQYPAKTKDIIPLWQFSSTGDFVKELHVSLPQEIELQGRTWHPISHLTVQDNTM